MDVIDIHDFQYVAETVLEQHSKVRVFALKGEMGAGKTTFVKYLCKALNSQSLVSSPTFTIVNEYVDGDGDSIYHFDLYRLELLDEVRQIGFEDYVFSGHYCFIEWPDIALSLLPENSVVVNLKVDEISKKRIVEF